MENIAPQVLKRVAKEITELASNCPDGIKMIVNEEDITDIQAIITGPGECCHILYVPGSHNTLEFETNFSVDLFVSYPLASTPYEGGAFRVKLILSDGFPASPPKGLFLTKIFHPNVSKTGEICVNTLKKDWKSDYGIAHVLTVVKCLLIYPNAESALNEDAGKLLLERFVASFCG